MIKPNFNELKQNCLSRNDSSLMDAASKGALAAIPLVLGIIANIVAFVAFVGLVNSILAWLGMLIGYDSQHFPDPLSLEVSRTIVTINPFQYQYFPYH